MWQTAHYFETKLKKGSVKLNKMRIERDTDM